MTGKHDPATESEWHEYYRAADVRRRRAGWRRADEVRHHRRKRGPVDPARVLTIVMGLAAVAVALCLVIPG
jgi:hypothetical protein